MTETTPPTQHYKNSVVRIYQGNKVIGAGFLIEGGYVLTCAHVVRDALGQRRAKQPVGSEIKLQFPLLDPKPKKKLAARVLVYQVVGEQLDVAGLQLLEPPPGNAFPMPLLPKYQWGDAFSAYGFPEGYPGGLWSDGCIKDECARENSSSWVQIQGETKEGYGIRPGFSGAPIWNHREAAIVGMTVRRDAAEPDSKIAFMIPARSLLKVQKQLQFLSLLNLLQPQAEEALNTAIQQAYSLVAPEGWSELPPETLEATLTNLQEMPQGDEAYPAIARFTALLCSPNLNPDEDLRRQLEAWLSQHRFDTQALLQSVQPLLTLQPQDAETARESHLLIYVKDDAGDEKSVLALFVPNAEHYDSHTGAVCDRVQAPGGEPFNEKITLETLPKLVRACINEVLPKSSEKNLVVQLILPFAWLHTECDRWSSTESSELLAALCLDIPQIPIGDDFSVVVRIAERLNPAIPELCRQKWQSKWNALDKLKPHERCTAFVSGDQYTGDQLVGELNKSGHVGLKRSTVCPEAEHRSLFGLLIGTGIPAALWLRQDQLDQSLIAADEIDTILNCKIARLPEAVRQCRADAMGQPKDKHIGHHLAFLWEDPNLVPPSTDPRSTIGMPQAS